VAAATANAAVWGPAVNGRVVIQGSDPVFHASQGGGQFTTSVVQFVAGETARTGAYISLSCYYHGTAEHTAVPLLNAFAVGGFTVRGVGCYNDAHIVASHPALAGITDATLSNWGCSVHEAFDAWPAASFDVLAIARGIGASYTASDGSVGTPYVLARGVSVISDITLAPLTGTSPTGTSYTLTATVREGGTATAGKAVTFTAIGGPNNGMTLTGTALTNASGQASASYTSALEGTDTWVAKFVDSASRTQTSNRATVEWTKPTVSKHSLAVDGTTGFAAVPDTAKLNLSGNWTVEAWFKDEDPNGYMHDFGKIVAKADPSVSREAPYFIIIGFDNIRAGVQANGSYNFASYDLAANGVSAGAWHHAAATLVAATKTLTLYLDGVQVAQEILDDLSAGNDLPLNFGRGGEAGYYFTGKIDDVRLWNVARTGAQIAASYRTEFSAPPAGLIGNWQFNEASGPTAADSTPAPANATLNGGASFSPDVHP
jgi:hypothetical protein